MLSVSLVTAVCVFLRTSFIFSIKSSFDSPVNTSKITPLLSVSSTSKLDKLGNCEVLRFPKSSSESDRLQSLDVFVRPNESVTLELDEVRNWFVMSVDCCCCSDCDESLFPVFVNLEKLNGFSGVATVSSSTIEKSKPHTNLLKTHSMTYLKCYQVYCCQ